MSQYLANKRLITKRISRNKNIKNIITKHRSIVLIVKASFRSNSIRITDLAALITRCSKQA